MMNKFFSLWPLSKILLFLQLFHETSALGCSLPFRESTYVYLHDPKNLLEKLQPVFSSSDCPREVADFIKDFLVRNQNSIEGQQLQQVLKENFGQMVGQLGSAPLLVNFVNLQGEINKKFAKGNEKIFIKSIVGHAQEQAFSFSQDYRPHFDCSNCETLGEKTLKFYPSYQQGKNQEFFWVNVVKKVQKMALVSARDLEAQEESLKPEDFSWQSVYVDNLTHLFVLEDLAQIKFYKTATRIKGGAPLNGQDLIKKYVVQVGQQLKLVLQDGQRGIEISQLGTSQSRGRIGDTIPVKIASSGKILSAKVINANEVSLFYE